MAHLRPNVLRLGEKRITPESCDWLYLAEQQAAYLVIRAMENRVAAVKADTGYNSLVIDPLGRVVATRSSSLASACAMITQVHLWTADAQQIWFGIRIGWIILVGLAFFVLPNPLPAGRERR